MLPKLTHTFWKSLSNHTKESIFDCIKVKIMEDTKTSFVCTSDTMKCEIPFFVSKWNPYGIFDRLVYTFVTAPQGNITFECETFHRRALFAKLWIGLFFSVLLWYTLPGEDIFWKVSLYIFVILLYVVGLLWQAHRRTKRLFQAAISYAENL